MKLLLVNPYFEGIVNAPSLGLGFIATYIKDNSDWEVEVVEPMLQGLSKKEVLVKASKSDVVGLTCYTESRFQCFDFAREVKRINPNCRLIVGGPHVTPLDGEILKHYPFIDAVVRGEGEETTLDIIRGKSFKEILGITWKSKEKIIRNAKCPLIRNIDHLYYDYSLILPQIEGWKDFEVPQRLQKVNNIPIIASRGCPFQCTFCAAHKQWGKIYRYSSPEELVKRMGCLVSQYNIRYFRFYDALFIGSDERMLKFCDLLEKTRLNVHFRIDIRVGTSRNVLERLRRVGCDVVGFGVESGSDKILKRINKGITSEQIEETIKMCKELDYWTIGFFMLSLPDETMDDVKKTLKFFEFFDVLNVQFFKVHPNTSFYNELKQRGEIDDEVWFDPNYGFITTYGNEIYYCKELFPSANFYRDEVNLLMDYSTYKYQITNPSAIIRRSGLTKGIFILALSAIMSTLLKGKVGRKLYSKFKKTYGYRLLRIFYRRLTKIKWKMR